jgi:hypothetical protein
MGSLKSTIQLMVSIIALGANLARTSPDAEGSNFPVAGLKAGIRYASELISSQRSSIANLQVVEEQAANPHDASPSSNIRAQVQCARIYSWLDGVVGLSECGSGSGHSVSRSAGSTSVSVVLSEPKSDLVSLAMYNLLLFPY